MPSTSNTMNKGSNPSNRCLLTSGAVAPFEDCRELVQRDESTGEGNFTLTEPSRRFTWSLRLLSGVALGVSGYLAVTALQAGEVAGCGGGQIFDCSHVLHSRWSKAFGVPVSIPAFALYALMLTALAVGSAKTPGLRRRLSWGFVTIGSVAAGLAGVWFIGLQAMALGHLCAYCLAAHTCGLVLCGLILWVRPLGTKTTAWLSMVSVAGVGVLVGGQLLAEAPPTFKIERYPDVEKSEEVFEVAPGGVEGVSPLAVPANDEDDFEIFESPIGPEPSLGAMIPQTLKGSKMHLPRTRQQQATVGPLMVAILMLMLFANAGSVSMANAQEDGDAATAKQSDEKSAEKSTDKDAAKADADDQADKAGAEAKETPERRLIKIAGGNTALDVLHWPLLGSHKAKYVFVEMFDYTCPHCRATHVAVHGAMQRYGDDLAILALPVPLNSACNNAVSSNSGTHAQACDIAKIAIAVWRIDRKQFPAFHSWLFASQQARSTAEARQHAASLVGDAALSKELGQPYADQYIAAHVRLYKRAGAGSVPKLLFPKSTVVGAVNSTDRLCDLIDRELVAP